MVDKLLSEIHELGNHPWKRDVVYTNRIKWEMLWTSIDIIGDTSTAINSFRNLNFPKYERENLLYVYGLLQLIFVQQDCLNSLNKSLFDKTINYKTEYPTLYALRDLRNKIVGHPTNSKREKQQSFHQILSDSITKESFEFISYYPQTDHPKKGINKIAIKDLIDVQKSLAVEILEKVKNKLKEEINTHMDKFKSEKLTDLIPSSISYHFGKLYSGIYTPTPITKMDFEMIVNSYEKIKEGIIERYNSISALSGIDMSVKKLDYIIKNLKVKLIDNNPIDEIDTEIYINGLEREMKEFFEMLREIDQEFN